MTKLSDIRFPQLRRTVLLIALASFASGSTCADVSVPPQANCVFDDECDRDEVCLEGGCIETCTSDEDCSSQEICRSELRAEQQDVVDVCVPDDDVPPDDETECETDAECDDAFPGRGARCAIDGVCYFPAFSLLVRDTTAVEPAVAADDGGLGADIVAIYLRDRTTGEPLAWAETIAVHPANDVAPQNAPDGTRARLNEEGTCSERAYEQAATPLGGDGGTLLVRFLESATGRIVSSPLSAWDIVVVEWGDNCPGGELGPSDSYEVYACAASTHRNTDPARDCPELLGVAPAGGVLEVEGTP